MLNEESKKDTSHIRPKLLLIGRLIEPSMLGIFIYVALFVVTFLIREPWKYKTDLHNLHSNQLQGTLVYRYIKDVGNVINTQIANQVAGYIFWGAVALLVYIIAYRVVKNFIELSDDLSLRQYIWPKGSDKNRPLKEFIEKLFFHVITGILILLYIFKILPALARVWARTNLTLKLSVHSLTPFVFLFLLELVCLHLGVILLRLFLIRQRVVGTQ